MHVPLRPAYVHALAGGCTRVGGIGVGANGVGGGGGGAVGGSMSRQHDTVDENPSQPLVHKRVGDCASRDFNRIPSTADRCATCRRAVGVRRVSALARDRRRRRRVDARRDHATVHADGLHAERPHTSRQRQHDTYLRLASCWHCCVEPWHVEVAARCLRRADAIHALVRALRRACKHCDHHVSRRTRTRRRIHTSSWHRCRSVGRRRRARWRQLIETARHRAGQRLTATVARVRDCAPHMRHDLRCTVSIGILPHSDARRQRAVLTRAGVPRRTGALPRARQIHAARDHAVTSAPYTPHTHQQKTLLAVFSQPCEP
jgi:hypothetical protein